MTTLSHNLALFRKAIKIRYIALVKEKGFKASKGTYILPAFNICAETGARLDSSTIDEVRVYADRNIEFVYNSNEDNCDDFISFTVEELVGFYDAIVRYINDVENENK